jgi:hypothetical protein
MKTIISTTYDDKYLFFLPIVTWAWNKLGVDVICFMPYKNTSGSRFMLVSDTLTKNKANGVIYNFDCSENKEATYAQCSRLFAHTVTTPEDGALIVSDVDMLVFKVPPVDPLKFTIWGADLVPKDQYPMCYIAAAHETWAASFSKYGDTLQQCLDNLLGDIDCENMRGNYWGKDQQTAFEEISKTAPLLVNRAKDGTQFATHRIDRDDAFFLERLTPDIVDYHAHRPGYTESNVEKIISVISFMYPDEDLNWIRTYANEYRKLL